jgi:4-hydroxy-2-oxoheptanedioate aldolase
MMDNKLIEKLKKGQPVAGCWSLMGSLEAVEMMGYSGFDFVIIDRQHTYYGLDKTENLLRAATLAGITPIVRVSDKSSASIMKALDAGAMGILVPTVSTAHEAELIVEAAKYPPLGKRSACPDTRAVQYGMLEWESFADLSNQNTMVWLIVEGPEGVKNFSEIVKVKGVHSIVMGPFDLSQSIGYPGKPNHPKVLEHLEEMVKIAKGAMVQMVAVIFETDPIQIKEKADQWIARGCNILTVASDRTTILNGFTLIAQKLSLML